MQPYESPARSTLSHWSDGAVQRLVVPFVVAALVLLADQASKAWVLQRWPEPYTDEIQIIPNWLDLMYVQNTGVAFGLFRGFSEVFTITSLVIVAAAVWWYLRHRPEPQRWFAPCLGLIVGGALGNVIDRIRLGFVVDFIKTFDGRFPVFNIADSCVVVGIGILAWLLARHEATVHAHHHAAPREADDGA